MTGKQGKVTESSSEDFLQRLQMKPFFFFSEGENNITFKSWVAAIVTNVEQNTDLHLHKLKERKK